MASDLGTRLVRAGLISRGQLADALAVASRDGVPLVAALVAGGLPEEALAGFFVAEGHGPLVDAGALERADPNLTERLPAPMADTLCVFPVASEGGAIVVAMGDPTDAHAVRELERVLRAPVRPRVTRLSWLRVALARRAAERAVTPATAAGPAPADPAGPTVVEAGAAEAHVEPDEAAVALVRRKRPSSASETFDEAQALMLVRTKPVTLAPSAGRAPTGDSSTHGSGAVVLETPVESATRASHAVSTGPQVFVVPAITVSGDSWASLGAGDTASGGLVTRRPAFLEEPAERTAADRRRDTAVATPAVAGLPDPGPALAALRGATERDEAVRLACVALARAGRCAIFLALKKDVLQGRAVVGGSVSREAVYNLWIPMTSASTFRDAVMRGVVHFGPYGSSVADAIFRAAIDSPGGDAVVAPVVVAGKPVGVLVCDDVHVGARVQTLAAQVAAALGESLARVIASKRR